MFRYFHASPVDLGNLADWGDLADRLRGRVRGVIGRGCEVEITTVPRLAPGVDIAEQLAALEEQRLPPRGLTLELWSAHRGHGVVATTVGDGIVRRERRALLRMLDKVMAPHPRLAEQEGPWNLDRCTAFGYALDPTNEADRVQIRWLIEALDQPLYLGERWLLQDRSEAIDPARYSIHQQLGPQRVVFVAETEEAELDVWAQATSGEGLIALDPDDGDLALFARRFGEARDLETFLVHPESHELPRITLGRGQPGADGPRVMVYDPPGYAPDIEALPVFFL